MITPAPEYVSARRALLDALAALADHLDNLILVGAQAVYHHAGEAELSVPIMTTDGDLAINTHGLEDAPEIGKLLRDVGFTAGPNPGHWIAPSSVAVDLMVVPHQAGTSKPSARAARLQPHEKFTARIARGLEPALVDNTHVVIGSFEPDDDRSVRLRVAGPAALLTAKGIKMAERLELAGTEPHRVKNKDALDAFRIFQAVETDDLVRGFGVHSQEEHAAAVSKEAIELYREHASTPQGALPVLAGAAAQGDPSVAPAFAALVTGLLAALS